MFAKKATLRAEMKFEPKVLCCDFSTWMAAKKREMA
jgi:hypothetical protein